MKTAFSLIELAVVLVILGLLVGAILAGQNLIRAAEIRAIAVEYDGYRTAINQFIDKYDALPGDMDFAEDLWGSVTASGGTCPNDPGTGTETCNGDDNGEVGWAPNGGIETLRFWQHLSNAGLIDGQYTGVDPDGGSDGNNGDHDNNINAPGSRLSQAGWSTMYRGYFGGGSHFLLEYGHELSFGGEDDHLQQSAPILTPEEMWSIDTKIDDGKPAKGTLVSREDRTKCVDASNGADAPAATDYESVYELNYDETACVLVFRNIYD